MRRLLLLALLLPAPLAAQRAYGIHRETPPAPAPAPAPRPVPTPTPDVYGRYPRPYYVEAPRISIDSAVRIIETKYEGWLVDNKEMTRYRQRPIYRFGMVSAGITGTRDLWVDGNTGRALNPEVLGLTDAEAADYHYRPYPTTPTYP